MNRRRFLGALPFLYALPTMGWAGFAPSQPSSRYYRLAQYNGSWSLQAPRLLNPCSISHFGGPVRKILKTGKEFSFVDVWDSSFQTGIAAALREDGRRFRKDSNLIGWIWTDSLPWDLASSRLSRETDWVSFIRQLPAHAPGKRQYVDFLLRRYRGDIPTINRLYGTNCRSRVQLLKFPFIKVDWQQQAIYRDDTRFLQRIAGEYYRQLANMCRRHDPNHLLFGDIYGPSDHPRAVLNQAVKYVDALCLHASQMKPAFPEESQAENRDGNGSAVPSLDHLYHRYRKPIVLFGSPDQRAWAMKKPCLIGFCNRPARFDYGEREATSVRRIEVKLGNRIFPAQLPSKV